MQTAAGAILRLFLRMEVELTVDSGQLTVIVSLRDD